MSAETLAGAVRSALARPRDLALAATLPARLELAVVVAADAALEPALPPLLEAVEGLGIPRTHLEIVLACAADGSARSDARDRLRAALAPARVHAHDATRGDTFVAAWLDREPVSLDDALRESEALVLVLAARAGAAGATLAGETLAGLADAATRERVQNRARPLADAVPIDLGLVIDTGQPPRAWAGSGRWLLAERFPPAERGAGS
jgi:hypothetical protein